MTEETKSDSQTTDVWPEVPEDEKCRIWVNGPDGELIPAKPKHRVDPLGKTEAVAKAAKPKTLLERLRDLMKTKTPIELLTRGQSEGAYKGTIVEVTNEVIVLKVQYNGKERSSTILVDAIESFCDMSE